MMCLLCGAKIKPGPHHAITTCVSNLQRRITRLETQVRSLQTARRGKEQKA